MDVEEFRRRGYEMVDFICEYYSTLEQRPVRSEVEPGYLRPQLPGAAPEAGESFDAILQDVRDKVMPGVTHWQSPNFFAYFPANSSYPGILGEMLSAAINCIGFSWVGSPAATELETVVLDWLGQLLGLPAAFLSVDAAGAPTPGGGVIQSTASDAALVALLAARARALAGRPPADGALCVAYTSDQAHSAVTKACMVAGVTHLRTLPTKEEDDWALSPDTLEAAVRADLAAGLLPTFLYATLGTTSSCAVDPLPALGAIAQRHSLWMHVDAAYAGVAAICPEMRGPFAGLELVDSFNTNAHKWLLTNFDCSPMWVRDAGPLKAALSLTPAFLRAKANTLDYKDWQVPLGRRFRALKLWFVLRSYGAERLRAYLRHHCGLAAWFVERVRGDGRFELAAPPRFGLVCFRLKGASREQSVELLERVNRSGRAFIIATELGGRHTLRFALGAASVQVRTPHPALSSTHTLVTATLSAPSLPAGLGGRAFIVATERGGRHTLRLALGAASLQARHVEAAWQLISEQADAVLAHAPSAHAAPASASNGASAPAL